MHELSLVRNLLSIILDRASGAKALRVVSVDLAVGELCDARPEWIERYFRLAARGTIAEDSALRFSVIESAASCAACGRAFRPALRSRAKIRCPDCGSDECVLSLGTDYRIERLEVL